MDLVERPSGPLIKRPSSPLIERPSIPLPLVDDIERPSRPSRGSHRKTLPLIERHWLIQPYPSNGTHMSQMWQIGLLSLKLSFSDYSDLSNTFHKRVTVACYRVVNMHRMP